MELLITFREKKLASKRLNGLGRVDNRPLKQVPRLGQHKPKYATGNIRAVIHKKPKRAYYRKLRRGVFYASWLVIPSSPPTK